MRQLLLRQLRRCGGRLLLALEHRCHLVGLGNTEEKLIRDNYGLAERGVGTTESFDHATGAGHVSAVKGLYHDCIHVKNQATRAVLAPLWVNQTAAAWCEPVMRSI